MLHSGRHTIIIRSTEIVGLLRYITAGAIRPCVLLSMFLVTRTHTILKIPK